MRNEKEVGDWIETSLKRAPYSIHDRDCIFVREHIDRSVTYELLQTEGEVKAEEHNEVEESKEAEARQKKVPRSKSARENALEDDGLLLERDWAMDDDLVTTAWLPHRFVAMKGSFYKEEEEAERLRTPFKRRTVKE